MKLNMVIFPPGNKPKRMRSKDYDDFEFPKGSAE